MCVDTGECVDICDTLSQQMYVISFRRREREGKMKESKQKTPPQKNQANERKLQDLAESRARGLL